MSSWNDLTMRDKSELIRLFVKHGVQNLNDIRNTYNSYAEGGPVNPPNKRKLQASDAVMHWLSERIAPADETDYDPAPAYTPSDWDDTAEGMAQATYLLGRDEQRRAFLNKGYIQGQDRDYGLVQRAANATNTRRGDVTPVFQTKPDEISRDNLIHIGNRLDATLSDEDDVSIYFKTPERRLRNAEHYPAALYIGTDGKPYGKGWDLNDYGLYDGQPDNYKYGILNIGAKVLDRIGSPTVVTTGFGEVGPTYTHDDYARNHYLRWNPHTESYEGSSYDIVITPNGWRGLRDGDEDYFANGGKMYFPGGPIATIGSTYSVPWEDAAQMYMNDVQAWNDIPEITITPNGNSYTNPVPEASYYRHTSNGSVPVITDENKWQEYWGNRGGQYMRDAQDKWGGLALGLTGAAVAPAIGGAFAGAGDAVMAAGNKVATNPWLNAGLTSYGVANSTNKLYNGQVGRSNLEDVDTFLGFVPLAYNTKTLINGAKYTWDAATKAHPILEQYPRYVVGKFKYGFDAQLPQLIRRTETPLSKSSAFSNQVYWTNPKSRFAYMDLKPSPPITNMTTDQSVLRHGRDSWEGMDYNILPGKYLLGKHVVSTRPMDTFTFGDVWKVPKKDVVTISGRNPDSPMHTLFSNAKDGDKAKGLYEQALQAEAEKVLRHPTAKDYQFMDYVFRPQYSSNVMDKSVLRGKDFGEVFPTELPEFMREVVSSSEARTHLYNKGLWHNVYYDPKPDVEARFRDAHGIELINLIKKGRQSK